jgi:hypothetical protein
VVLFVWTVRQVCSDIPYSGADVRFSGISYVALRQDGISNTSGHFSPSLLIFCQFVRFFFGFSCASLTCSCLFAISLHPKYDSFPFLLISFKFFFA